MFLPIFILKSIHLLLIESLTIYLIMQSNIIVPFGTITVLLSSTNDVVKFSVEDTGIGISDEDQKAIFDPYYQSSRAKRNIQGIGMGLLYHRSNC